MKYFHPAQWQQGCLLHFCLLVCLLVNMRSFHLLQWQQGWHQGRCRRCCPGLACTSATNQFSTNVQNRTQNLLLSIPCQTHGSQGMVSLMQTVPDHRCGCMPVQLVVFVCKTVQNWWESESDFHEKCTIQVEKLMYWDFDDVEADLFCCTLGHAGRVWKCKDDRHLVESAEYHVISDNLSCWFVFLSCWFVT